MVWFNCPMIEEFGSSSTEFAASERCLAEERVGESIGFS
jgi:hypothetical protein